MSHNPVFVISFVWAIYKYMSSHVHF